MARFTLRTKNGFANLGPSIIACMAQVVRDTTDEAVRRAKSDAPVLTGALQASIHAVNDERSDYTEAAAEAMARRPVGHPDVFGAAEIYPEVKPDQPLHALMAACVGHGAVNEFGGANFPARPFFVPAVEGLAADFERDLTACLNNAPREQAEETGDVAEGAPDGALDEVGEVAEAAPEVLALAAL